MFKLLKSQVSQHNIVFGIVVVIIFSLLRTIMTNLWVYIFGSFLFIPTLQFIFFISIFFIIISIVLIYLVLIKLSGNTISTIGWKSDNFTRIGLYGFGGFILVYINTIVWAGLTGNLGETPQLLPFDLIRVLLFAYFGFGLAAWVEENIFRGYLQHIFITKYGTLKGILLQALIFSIAHIGFYQNSVNYFSAFTFGIIIGIIREKSGGLVAPFIAHGLYWMIPAFINVSLSL